MIKQNTFTPASNVRILFPIGCLFDIPTGSYVKGFHGENILIGGLGMLTGVVGRPNRFKSMLMHFMTLSAADRVASTTETSIGTYDTEINMSEQRLNKFAQAFRSFKDKDIFEDGTWIVTDKTICQGDKWFEQLKSYTDNKVKNRDSITVSTPFISRDKVNPITIITPTFGQCDSFSAFSTSDVEKMQDENELGSSGGNTIHMRQGLAKTRFMMEIPTIAGTANHYFLLTAHVGQETSMASGPYAPIPVKKLQHLKVGEKIKGVTDQFLYLMSNCWHAVSATLLIHKDTKTPEYPRNKEDSNSGDTDLNLVQVVQLRSKSGQTGVCLEIVVSQTDGVLPGLTEFHYLKSNDRYGISGTLQNYNLDLLPDVKLSRTSVRGKIDNDPKLQRALNITAELLQLQQYHRPLADRLCTPKELYDGLNKLGYDWDILLNTRGWWTVEDDKHPIPRMSTLDFCDCLHGTYHPYWYPIKKEDLVLK